MTALKDTEVPVPNTYGLCEDKDLIGTEFFVMDFLDGNIYWDLLLTDKSPEERKAIYLSKNKVIAELHKVDYESVGLTTYGKPGNYIARQVSRWTKQYLASQTEEIDAMNKLIDWLPGNIPDEDETCIVHGDYRLDNMVFGADNKVAGILQGIIGRVRDGTAASKHAEDRADQVRPLAEAAWSLVEQNYK